MGRKIAEMETHGCKPRARVVRYVVRRLGATVEANEVICSLLGVQKSWASEMCSGLFGPDI